MVKSLTEKENRGEIMAIPKYQYIKDELKNKIISGQFASGDKFYTEAELIAMYDVSSITVVRALNDLAKDGYIVRQQGKGTFVSRARKHKLVEFSDVEVFETKDDKVTVLSIEQKQTGMQKKKDFVSLMVEIELSFMSMVSGLKPNIRQKLGKIFSIKEKRKRCLDWIS